MPAVSVIMSVYNDERFVEAAVDSLLGQTFRDFELIVIDDGSTDRCPEILDTYAARDDRIRLVHQENVGLQTSLNRAAALAEGTYVARMDADDVSLPDRFEKQVAYLERHPHVSLLATTMKEMDEDGAVTGNVWKEDVRAVRPEHIYHTLAYTNCIVHASVMLRREVLLDEPYDESFRYVEDYELWTRLSRSHVLAKIGEPLLHWRRHGKSMTAVSYETDDTTHDITRRIRQSHLSKLLGLELTQEQAVAITGRLKEVPARRLPGLLLLRLRVDLRLLRQRPEHLSAFPLMTRIFAGQLRFARRVVKQAFRRLWARLRVLWSWTSSDGG